MQQHLQSYVLLALVAIRDPNYLTVVSNPLVVFTQRGPVDFSAEVHNRQSTNPGDGGLIREALEGRRRLLHRGRDRAAPTPDDSRVLPTRGPAFVFRGFRHRCPAATRKPAKGRQPWL